MWTAKNRGRYDRCGYPYTSQHVINRFNNVVIRDYIQSPWRSARSINTAPTRIAITARSGSGTMTPLWIEATRPISFGFPCLCSCSKSWSTKRATTAHGKISSSWLMITLAGFARRGGSYSARKQSIRQPSRNDRARQPWGLAQLLAASNLEVLQKQLRRLRGTLNNIARQRCGRRANFETDSA
jgi:hypothetical protein